MIKLQRTKPYKASPPSATIFRIKQIINDLGIITSETFYQHTNAELNSWKISVVNKGLNKLDICTFGKGLSPEYALASGYGEFIERLQNNYLFTNRKYATKQYLSSDGVNNVFAKKLSDLNLTLDFLYAPDEIDFQIDEYIKANKEILSSIFQIEPEELADYFKNKLSIEKILGLPFFSVSDQRIEYIPIQIVSNFVGSNGMCAGNTKEEALIQGLCEIFERFSINSIFSKQLSPPTIPLECFEGTEIFQKLLFLQEKHNLKFIIKDCSLGIGLPVIGVLIIDRTNNNYTFHLGSDPSPITALERCITEVYAGEDFFPKFIDINFSFDLYKNSQSFIKEQQKKILINGTGIWPNSIFMAESSYHFSGFKHFVSTSDTDDLRFLVNKVKNLNYNIYIRDVSFLGFPSFQIYIPGLSELHFKSIEDLEVDFKLRANINTLFDIKEASDDKLKILADCIEKTQLSIKDLFPYNTSDNTNISKDLILSMIHYKLQDFGTSLLYIQKYLEGLNDNFTYYSCIRDYIKLVGDNYTENDIVDILLPVYGDDLLTDVRSDLASPGNVFQYLEFPNCFKCHICNISEDCHYFEALAIMKNLQKKYSDNVINQSSLVELFKD